MGFFVFVFILLLLAFSAYLILLTRLRSFTCRDVAVRLEPLSDDVRKVLSEDTQGHVPTTLLEFGDMYKVANNLKWLTVLSDRFRLAIGTCTDDYFVANMELTHRTFVRKRAILVKSLLVGIAHLCFGKLRKDGPCAHMGIVAQTYADVVMLGAEMAEVMDDTCVPYLEGQFLHG